MANEQSGMGGRFRRYAKVTGTMGNLAMKMAGERYLGIKVDRDNHAVQLRDALGNLKGPLMKVAQILATIPEALPREYAEELANLQTDAPPMGWLFVKRRMAVKKPACNLGHAGVKFIKGSQHHLAGFIPAELAWVFPRQRGIAIPPVKLINPHP